MKLNDPTPQKEQVFAAPVFLAGAFFIFGLAIIEKVLNMFGTSMPFTTVWPRQLLNWAVTLLIFDIALTLRQMLENRL